MLCFTEETKSTILVIRERESADEHLQLALSARNSIGAWDWDVPNNIVRAAARFAVLYGVDPSKAAAGASIDEFFGRIHPARHPDPSYRRRLAVHRPSARPDGGPHHDVLPALDDDDR